VDLLCCALDVETGTIIGSRSNTCFRFGQLSVAGESTIFIFIGFPSDQPGLVNGTLGFLDCRLSNLELSSLSNMTSHES
jgi:hypothetical protein